MNDQDTTAARSIDDYLKALRRALEGADPALIHDALSDAESHLRAECSARPNESEESVLRSIADSYGLPEDVAAAYLETDQTVQRALTPPRTMGAKGVNPSAGLLRRFFAVYGDVRSWTSLMFMLLSMFTGILYFCVVVTGASLSLGLMILIIGIPFFIGFIGLTRVLALVEGRLVEAMTGERMPRRAPHTKTGGWLQRIGAMLRDVRTWSTLAYQLLSLPLGVLYFSVAITLSAFGFGLVGAGAWELLRLLGVDLPSGGLQWGSDPESLSPIALPVVAVCSIVLGVVTLTALLHLARLIGRVHGKIAKRLLVAF
jgi:uncharacterized membrane protein